MPFEDMDDGNEIIGEDEAEDILMLATLIGIGPGEHLFFAQALPRNCCALW
jgi:hypothetical protein